MPRKRATKKAVASQRPNPMGLDPPRIDEGDMYIAQKDLVQVQALFQDHKIRRLEAELIPHRMREERERHLSAMAGMTQDATKAKQLAVQAQAALKAYEDAIALHYGLEPDYSYEPTTGKIYPR